MEPLSTNELRIHPEMLHVLHARARRARAEAMYNVFARLLARISKREPGKQGGAFGRLHWG
jgi:hypothetical protein